MSKWILVMLVLLALAAPADSDVLEERALAHDLWANTYHFNPYGGVGYVYFTTPESDDIHRFSFSDSTIWTGTYLAGEAFRYAVTGDPEAKANAIRTVHALDAHLKITQVPGFIARCASPDEPPYNTGYPGHSRYVAGTGQWEGSFWLNNTSRDQYTGWFFGMATAYDLVDDEPMRELIRQDVKEVVDELRKDNWWIIGENGLPTDAAPRVIFHQRLNWTLIAAHVLDDPDYFDLYEKLYDEYLPKMWIDTFSWVNKYDAYFGFNLSHNNFFTLFRLERSAARRAALMTPFYWNIRTLVQYTHNPFFDVIYLSQCARAGACVYWDDHVADVPAQLLDFQDPPVREVPKAIPPAPLDPLSVFLSWLVDELNIRNLLDIEPQTADARPVLYRCPRSFMWQKNPYNIDCPGGDGTEVYPGIDYMVAYWMGRYYNFIEPGNPNEIYWPPDNQPDDDDDDNDDNNDNDTTDDDDASDDDDSAPTQEAQESGGESCGC